MNETTDRSKPCSMHRRLLQGLTVGILLTWCVAGCDCQSEQMRGKVKPIQNNPEKETASDKN